MDGCAGYCRHDVPSCRQNRGASAPRLALFMDIRHDLTVSGSCPARTGEGRVTEPQSLTAVSIASRCGRPVFGLGMWHGVPPNPHSGRTGNAQAGTVLSAGSRAPRTTRRHHGQLDRAVRIVESGGRERGRGGMSRMRSSCRAAGPARRHRSSDRRVGGEPRRRLDESRDPDRRP